MTVVLLFLVFAVLLVLGFTAPVALGATAVLYLVFFWDPGQYGTLLAGFGHFATRAVFDYVLGAIVLFIFYGRLCAAMDVRARLAMCFTRMLGSARVSASASEVLTSLAMPDTAGDALLQRNDDAAASVNRLRLAGTAGWSALGQAAALASLRTLMPPGVAIIVIAYVAELSVIRLFGWMLLPALVLAVLVFVLALFGGRDKEATQSTAEEPEWLSLVWLIATPMILFMLLRGIMTPSEAAAFAVVLAIVLGLALRQLTMRLFFRATLDTLYDAGAIFLVVVFARMLTWAFVMEGGTKGVSDWAFTFGPMLALAGIAAFFVASGALTGMLISMFVFCPLILPVGALFGFDPQTFALVILIAATIGLSVPPVGAIFATLAAGTTERLSRTAAGIILFALPILAILVLALPA